ncbi:MAG: hypothetical protein LRY51_12580 [Geovibrio sp.]|nr:hypothetical protein [Geovibrio sp.]
MKSSEEFLSNVFAVLGHINQAIERNVSILLEKKVEGKSSHFNVILKGEKEGEVFVMASDLTEEQLKWYVFGLVTDWGLPPNSLKITQNSQKTA